MTNVEYAAYLNSSRASGSIEVRSGVVYATGGSNILAYTTTAVAGTDFFALNVDVTFAKGETRKEIPIQLGGGIRDLDTIERYLDDGLSYIIIGTAAVKNPGFLHDACGAFPGHIMVGLDAREGKVDPAAAA